MKLDEETTKRISAAIAEAFSGVKKKKEFYSKDEVVELLWRVRDNAHDYDVEAFEKWIEKTLNKQEKSKLN